MRNLTSLINMKIEKNKLEALFNIIPVIDYF